MHSHDQPDPYGNRTQPLSTSFAEWIREQDSPDTPLLLAELFDIMHDLMFRTRRHLTKEQLKKLAEMSADFVERMIEEGDCWRDLDTGEDKVLITKEMIDADPALEEIEKAAYGSTVTNWDALLR